MSIFCTHRYTYEEYKIAISLFFVTALNHRFLICRFVDCITVDCVCGGNDKEYNDSDLVIVQLHMYHCTRVIMSMRERRDARGKT